MQNQRFGQSMLDYLRRLFDTKITHQSGNSNVSYSNRIGSFRNIDSLESDKNETQIISGLPPLEKNTRHQGLEYVMTDLTLSRIGVWSGASFSRQVEFYQQRVPRFPRLVRLWCPTSTGVGVLGGRASCNQMMLEFVTGRGGGFSLSRPAVTRGWGRYFLGDPRPRPRPGRGGKGKEPQKNTPLPGGLVTYARCC